MCDPLDTIDLRWLTITPGAEAAWLGDARVTYPNRDTPRGVIHVDVMVLLPN